MTPPAPGPDASLAPFIHAMGRGPSRARNLTRAEAAEAMRLMLVGHAAPRRWPRFLASATCLS
ncbi:anthranilate phosphoribosyltransferase [Rhodobacteraceae bacterium MBR-64]|jgi:anthranilate phosphoribosyltransferase